MYLKGISSNYSFLSYEVGAKFKEADLLKSPILSKLFSRWLEYFYILLFLLFVIDMYNKIRGILCLKSKTTKMNPSIIMASLSHFAACIRETFHACIDIMINIRILQLAALGASHMIQYVLLAAMPWSYMCPVSFPRII
jgi:hypothetical protein